MCTYKENDKERKLQRDNNTQQNWVGIIFENSVYSQSNNPLFKIKRVLYVDRYVGDVVACRLHSLCLLQAFLMQHTMCEYSFTKNHTQLQRTRASATYEVAAAASTATATRSRLHLYTLTQTLAVLVVYAWSQGGQGVRARNAFVAHCCSLCIIVVGLWCCLVVCKTHIRILLYSQTRGGGRDAHSSARIFARSLSCQSKQKIETKHLVYESVWR